MSKSEFSSKQLAELDMSKLNEQLSFLKKEQFNLRFQQTLGELSNVSKFSKVRKNIARINTELTKRKIAKENKDA